MDWQLQIMVDQSLSRYAQQDADVRSVGKRPLLTICLDKGSDGWCAAWFLVEVDSELAEAASSSGMVG